MEKKYTPGPWHLREQGCKIEVRKGIYVVAMVHNYNGKEQNQSNANLIAAAPELLEALEAMLSRFKHKDKGMIKADFVKELARRAIAKARGEVTP